MAHLLHLDNQDTLWFLLPTRPVTISCIRRLRLQTTFKYVSKNLECSPPSIFEFNKT